MTSRGRRCGVVGAGEKFQVQLYPIFFNKFYVLIDSLARSVGELWPKIASKATNSRFHSPWRVLNSEIQKRDHWLQTRSRYHYPQTGDNLQRTGTSDIAHLGQSVFIVTLRSMNDTTALQWMGNHQFMARALLSPSFASSPSYSAQRRKSLTVQFFHNCKLGILCERIDFILKKCCAIDMHFSAAKQRPHRRSVVSWRSFERPWQSHVMPVNLKSMNC